MSEPNPPRGGGRMSRQFGGLPLWGWGVIIAVGLGAIVYFRLHRAGAAQATTTTTDTGTSDQLSQYEQISSQLTGIEGTNEALLAAIKDMQGDKSRDADHDHDQDRGDGHGDGADNDRGNDRSADRNEVLARRERRFHSMPQRKAA